MIKKGLIIGINYKGSEAELRGCINDAISIKNLLINKYAYKQEDIMLLTDDSEKKPTRENILRAISWLTSNMSPGSNFFFHYSGHGIQIPDRNKDENDGFDECLVPLDYKISGVIIDDHLKELLSMKIAPGCKLISIIDACHSHSAFDLLWNLSLDDKNNFKMEKIGSYKETPGTVIQLSGCRDDQKSADSFLVGRHQGALTFVFLNILEKNGYKITYGKLLKELRTAIKPISQQIPCLSFGRYIDLGGLF